MFSKYEGLHKFHVTVLVSVRVQFSGTEDGAILQPLFQIEEALKADRVEVVLVRLSIDSVFNSRFVVKHALSLMLPELGLRMNAVFPRNLFYNQAVCSQFLNCSPMFLPRENLNSPLGQTSTIRQVFQNLGSE